MSSPLYERDLDRACKQLTALERFAQRRERFIDALDFDALDLKTKREIEMADEHVAEELLSGNFYVEHLAEMTAVGT